MEEIKVKNKLKRVKIPEGWLETKLGKVCGKIIVGIATEVKPYVRDIGVPIVRNQNIHEDYFDDSEMIFICEKFDEKNKNKRIKAGDILVVRTGSNVGKACIVPFKYNNAQTFTTLIIRIGERVESKFLSLHINSFGIKEVERLAVGGGKPNLNAGFLKDYKILLPSLPEQRAIAKVLGTIDQAIQSTEALIAQKELRKKWLMQNLLTGKKRLSGFEGEWRKMELGEFINESRIPSISNDVNKRITVKLNLKGIEKRDVRGSESEDATNYFVRKAGQFIYGKQNLHKGAFGIIPVSLDDFESSQDLPTFDFTNKIIPDYFLFFLSQENIYMSLEKISTGTGSKRIHPESLCKVKYQFPSLNEQGSISEILQTAHQEIKLLKAKAEKLREQKKGMMQVLLTGKVRVKVEKS